MKNDLQNSLYYIIVKQTTNFYINDSVMFALSGNTV